MANNPYVNKVVYDNGTLIDISDSTAEEADVASGKIFYKKDGSRAVGTGSSSGLTMDLLWTNSSPSSNFAAQTLTISNLSDYKYLLILVRGSTARQTYYWNVLAVEDDVVPSSAFTGISAPMDYTASSGSSIAVNGRRATVSGNSIVFGLCGNNSYCIPYKIYGVK